MNENKFTGKAGIYSKYRPSYPESFISYLFTTAGLNKESIIADVGSGTGILTELLLKRGCLVYGVEPNKDMQSEAINKLSGYNSFIPVNASAENTTLPDKTVDFITSAQAFHWFDTHKFRAECNRIMRKHGKVILVWNQRVTESELFIENDLINRKLCPNYKGFSNGMSELETNKFTSFFKNGIYDCIKFENNIVLDEEGFTGRCLSSSYAPKERESLYVEYKHQIRQLFQKYSSSGLITFPNITVSYIGEV